MRILLADSFEQTGLDALASSGFDLDYRPELQSTDLAGAVTEADVLVVRSTRVEADVFAQPGPLSLVVRAGAGTNTIDTAAAAQRAVFVANVPGKNSVAVAELTMGLILALDRRIADNVAEARSGRWNKKGYSESDGLMGKTLGIIGLGQIGLAVAERAAAFGMRTLVVEKDRDHLTTQRMKAASVETVPDQATLLRLSDIVSIHVPGSAQTRNLVDSDFLAQLAPGAITHHIGASTAQAQEAIAAEVVAMIRDYERGVARNVVNLTPPSEIGSILVVRHFDRVGVLSAVLGALREGGLNVQEMQNQVFAGAGASVASIHVQGEVTPSVYDEVAANPDVIFASVRKSQ
ncbi:MAG: hydroxyacid dehydrogenase [Actinobacteria bacterium]|nr:hydroxyacid dehydrogenase [Actinomycetota bacterium]